MLGELSNEMTDMMIDEIECTGVQRSSGRSYPY